MTPVLYNSNSRAWTGTSRRGTLAYFAFAFSTTISVIFPARDSVA